MEKWPAIISHGPQFLVYTSMTAFKHARWGGGQDSGSKIKRVLARRLTSSLDGMRHGRSVPTGNRQRTAKRASTLGHLARPLRVGVHELHEGDIDLLRHGRKHRVQQQGGVRRRSCSHTHTPRHHTVRATNEQARSRPTELAAPIINAPPGSEPSARSRRSPSPRVGHILVHAEGVCARVRSHIHGEDGVAAC